MNRINLTFWDTLRFQTYFLRYLSLQEFEMQIDPWTETFSFIEHSLMRVDFFNEKKNAII